MPADSRDGEMHLLPALPKGWTGHVRGLKAKGDAQADARLNGKLVSAVICIPKNCKPPSVRYQGRPADA